VPREVIVPWVPCVALDPSGNWLVCDVHRGFCLTTRIRLMRECGCVEQCGGFCCRRRCA
jgi:hypothetical protein